MKSFSYTTFIGYPHLKKVFRLFLLIFSEKLLLSLVFNVLMYIFRLHGRRSYHTLSYEFLQPLKQFKSEDINSKEYFKEVKRIIFNNMDLCGSLSRLSVLSFNTKYRKELKRNYDRVDPLFYVWLTITGKQRPEFDVQMFKQSNPSLLEKVD